MNFDSIEELGINEISELYDFETENSATWYGTSCVTFKHFAPSLCENPVNFGAQHCIIDCTDKIVFTQDAMKAKCNNYCGGTESFRDPNINNSIFYPGYYWSVDRRVNDCMHHYYSVHYGYWYSLRFGKCYTISNR